MVSRPVVSAARAVASARNGSAVYSGDSEMSVRTAMRWLARVQALKLASSKMVVTSLKARCLVGGLGVDADGPATRNIGGGLGAGFARAGPWRPADLGIALFAAGRDAVAIPQARIFPRAGGQDAELVVGQGLAHGGADIGGVVEVGRVQLAFDGRPGGRDRSVRRRPGLSPIHWLVSRLSRRLRSPSGTSAPSSAM